MRMNELSYYVVYNTYSVILIFNGRTLYHHKLLLPSKHTQTQPARHQDPLHQAYPIHKIEAIQDSTVIHQKRVITQKGI